MVIGILDSGTDILHEDLEGNIWVNPGEDLDGDGVVWDADDMNGIDDDGNGLVDDLVGWDFHNNNNDVVGPFYHGTHVAGIAGAVTNNGIGVAGVAGGWYPTQGGSKMLICGVGDWAPDGSILDDAILYAASEGADVITMSLSVSQSSAIDAAIETAHNTYGSFIDCSSGNFPNGNVLYPARARYVFAVGATDQNDERASFSSYGDSLDVVAPGVDIWSTRKNNSYGTGDGTSFSSPQVAGIAALLKSSNLSYTNLDIERIIGRSAEKVGSVPYNQNRKYGTWNEEMGYGRVNAFYAVAPPAAPQNLEISIVGVNDNPRLDWNANSEPDLKEYVVYKKINQGNWLEQARTTDTFYIDTSVENAELYASAFSDMISYTVTAVDYADLESGYSNTVRCFIPGGPPPSKRYAGDTGTETDIPKEFVLLGNYPNPFNPQTTIQFGLPVESKVHIVVYNIRGELVTTLINKILPAGYHQVSFNASNLASGIYLYRIQAGEFSQVRKMMLIK